MKKITLVLLLLGSTLLAEKATFAGGCFWCIESALQPLKGVKSAVSGYIGGTKKEANYYSVSSGRTKHYEAVEVEFDPKVISYEALLDVFWHNINPTDEGGQFADRGTQYKTAVFYHNKKQNCK